MSQHFGMAKSYAQANIQGSPNPQLNGVWWIQSEEDTGNGVGGVEIGGQILLICPTWLSMLKGGSSV